jgi:hypothetical protein
MGRRCHARDVGGRARRIVAVLALVVATLPGGCLATGWTRGTWIKPGVPREERLRDEYECQRVAVLGARADRAREALYAECMTARGYRRPR